MNNNDRIKQMEIELETLKREQRISEMTCHHSWSNVKYDPEKYRESHFSHYEPHGSDPYPVYVDSDTISTKDRWSRTCSKCGKVEYTYEQKAVKYEPKF